VIGSISVVRAGGSFSVLTLWIKVFYWMRLFDKSAYFINLIQQVVADIKTFMFMLLIILSAFANFFLIINYNHDPEIHGHYVASQFDVGVPCINALLEMYVIGLGELGFLESWVAAASDHAEGGPPPNIVIAYLAFVLATFLILIVFMNTIIAMMAQTFANVQKVQEERALSE